MLYSLIWPVNFHFQEWHNNLGSWEKQMKMFTEDFIFNHIHGSATLGHLRPKDNWSGNLVK